MPNCLCREGFGRFQYFNPRNKLINTCLQKGMPESCMFARVADAGCKSQPHMSCVLQEHSWLRRKWMIPMLLKRPEALQLFIFNDILIVSRRCTKRFPRWLTKHLFYGVFPSRKYDTPDTHQQRFTLEKHSMNPFDFGSSQLKHICARHFACPSIT